MRAGDLDAVLEIEGASFPKPWSRRQFESELANPVSVQLLLEISRGGSYKAAGYTVFWVIHGEAHILNIAVHPELRRLGLGRKLLTEAIDWMQGRGVYEVYLEVRKSNAAAITLYRSMGFEAIFERKNYYGDEDAIVMRLLLD